MSPSAALEPAAAAVPDTTAPEPGFNYLYRVNCGGAAYLDTHGQRWLADRDFRDGDSWGAMSWACVYPHLPPALASARRVFTPVTGTRDPALYQTFRYGRSELRYTFSLPDGDYRIELHFVEPWYGRGNCDAIGWRLFDVACNGATVFRDLDLFRDAGFGTALRKAVTTHVTGGRLEISFPRVDSYQAVISAIAIATRDADVKIPPLPTGIIALPDSADATLEGWLDTGDRAFADSTKAGSRNSESTGSSNEPDRAGTGLPLDERDACTTIANLPLVLRHQPWLRRTKKTTRAPLLITLNAEADVYAAVPRDIRPWPNWEDTNETVDLVGPTTESFALWRRHYNAHDSADIPHAILVAFVPTRPPPPPQAIRNLRVESSSSPLEWRAVGSLQRGDRPCGATGPAFAQLPSELLDADWLSTPEFETNPNLRVHLSAADHIEITIGMDGEVTETPGWLHDWQGVDQQSRLGSRSLKLYRRRFELGASITLGENGCLADGKPAPMYVVIARLVRPSMVYPTPSTTLSAANPVVSWTIDVGVGDRYGMVFPYRKSDVGAAQVRYELLDRNGTVLCTELLKWRETDSVARLRTCTSINAGAYQVRLTWLEGPPVTLSTLTVE